jgi:hypothetical protein
MQMEWGDTRVDVIAPLTHRLFSETNDNFVGILPDLRLGVFTPRRRLEKKAEEYIANGFCIGPLTVIRVQRPKLKLLLCPLKGL